MKPYYYEQKDASQKIFLKQYICSVNFLRFNWHGEFEFFLLLKGRIRVCTDGNVYTLGEDDLILINAHKGHTIIADEPDSVALVIHFPPSAFQHIVPGLKNIGIYGCASTAATRDNREFRLLRQYAGQMMTSAVSSAGNPAKRESGNHTQGGAPESAFFLHGAFLMFLGTLLSSFRYEIGNETQTKHEQKNKKIFQTVISYMEKNYNRRISLDDMARCVRYSRTYFSSFFRKNVGVSFYDYLTRIRFRNAVSLMNNTEKSLTEIAEECGFDDLKSFSAYYKKNFHDIPVRHHRKSSGKKYVFTDNDEPLSYIAESEEINAKLSSYQPGNSSETAHNEYLLGAREQREKRDAEIKSLCGQILELIKN